MGFDESRAGQVTGGVIRRRGSRQTSLDGYDFAPGDANIDR